MKATIELKPIFHNNAEQIGIFSKTICTEQLIVALVAKHNCEYVPDPSWCFGQDLVERIKWTAEANLYVTYSELINEFGLVEANSKQANELYKRGAID